MRGRRPSRDSNSEIRVVRACQSESSLKWLPYTPETLRCVAWNRLNTTSIASEISPTVHRARVASTARPSRLPGPPEAQSVIAFRQASARAESRDTLIDLRRSICASRTFSLSIERTSNSSSDPSGRVYLLTPTMTSSPRSIRACLLVADSSMRSFGRPASIALAIPPSFSTSAINSRARSASSLVSDSIM